MSNFFLTWYFNSLNIESKLPFFIRIFVPEFYERHDTSREGGEKVKLRNLNKGSEEYTNKIISFIFLDY